MSSETPRFIEQPLAGWGNYPVQRCRVFRPERRRELDAVLHAAPGQDGQAGCIARGRVRSYGDASLNEGGGTTGAGQRWDNEGGNGDILLRIDDSLGAKWFAGNGLGYSH
jgi:hypothetical protein